MCALTGPMICPRCGLEMNHHADKLVYAGSALNAPPSELVVEFHACPACGSSISRPA